MKKLFIATTPSDIKISNREVICGKEAISTYLSENEKGVLSAVNTVRETELKQAINVILNSNKDATFNAVLYDNDEKKLLISSDRIIDLDGYNRFLSQNYYQQNKKNHFEKISNEITFIETDKEFDCNNYFGLFELSRVIESLVLKNNDLNILQEKMTEQLWQQVGNFLTRNFRIEFGILQTETEEKQLTISFVEDFEKEEVTRLKYIVKKVAPDDFRIDKDYSYSEKENDFVNPEFLSEIDAKIYAGIFINFGEYILQNYEELLFMVESNVKEICIPIANYDSTLTINFVESVSNNKKTKFVDSCIIENEPENYSYKMDGYSDDEGSSFLSKTFIDVEKCPTFLQEQITKYCEKLITSVEKNKSKQKKLNFKERITGFFKK